MAKILTLFNNQSEKQKIYKVEDDLGIQKKIKVIKKFLM